MAESEKTVDVKQYVASASLNRQYLRPSKMTSRPMEQRTSR
ncbi:hypothetical protein ACVWXM_002356 [Bradyrhizobium sp. GM7.3]